MSGLFLSIAAFVDFSRGDGRRGASSPRRYVDVPSGSPRTYAVFARSLPFTAGINCAGDGQVRIYITVGGQGILDEFMLRRRLSGEKNRRARCQCWAAVKVCATAAAIYRRVTVPPSSPFKSGAMSIVSCFASAPLVITPLVPYTLRRTDTPAQAGQQSGQDKKRT